MRIQVDTTRCITAGQCVMNAPDVFDQDDNGVVTVLQPEPPTDMTEQVRAAVELCPSGALSILP